MKILVTGGAGFIGSHVVDAYVAAGHRVTVLDNLSSGKKKNLNPKAKFIRGDVRSASARKIIEKGRFDVINHHAAQIDVRRSVENPGEDAVVNVAGLLNVLEAARASKVRKVIFSASGGTYYGECRRPARENDRPDPLSPYGVSKLAGEHYLRAYRALHGLDFTVLRYGNVFGPRQDPHGEAGVVAIFCLRLKNGSPVWIFGNGRQQRDYVFVGDVARANLSALRRGGGEAFNIGMGRGRSVLDLLAGLKRVAGGVRPAVRKPPRRGELFRSVLDIRKAARKLGWKPRVSFQEGIHITYRALAGPHP